MTNEIAVEKIKEILNGVVRGSRKLPNTRAIADLAEAVEKLRREVTLAPHHKYDDEIFNKVDGGVSLILENLPHIIQTWKRMADDLGDEETAQEFRDMASLWVYADKYDALNRRFVPEGLDGQPARRNGPSYADHWHHIVLRLEDSFRAAMKSTNPGDLGLSSDGPVANFCHAAIKLIMGDDVKPDTIVQQIRRLRKRQDDRVTMTEMAVTRDSKD